MLERLRSLVSRRRRAASVPHRPEALPLVGAGDTAFVEAIQLLVHELTVQYARHGRRGVAVCGPSAGSGVSLLAANIAAGLARSGLSTLLVDADLTRQPEASAGSEVAPLEGLADLLSDPDRTLHDVLHPTGTPGLSLLPAGSPAESPSDLLGSQALEDVLHEAMRIYDFTIVDTPPANTTPNAVRLSAALGVAIVVGRRNLTWVDDIEVLVQQLKDLGVTVLGTVLNDG